MDVNVDPDQFDPEADDVDELWKRSSLLGRAPAGPIRIGSPKPKPKPDSPTTKPGQSENPLDKPKNDGETPVRIGADNGKPKPADKPDQTPPRIAADKPKTKPDDGADSGTGGCMEILELLDLVSLL